MAGGGTKPRPEYYNHCIASAMMLGVVIELDTSIPDTYAGYTYAARRVRVTLDRAHGYERYPRYYRSRWYRNEGHAAEGALAVMGYVIRRRQLVRIE